MIAQNTDPRIAEIEKLAAEDGRPLALSAATIIALEDAGWLADPFTALIWRDLSAPAPGGATLRRLAEMNQ